MRDLVFNFDKNLEYNREMEVFFSHPVYILRGPGRSSERFPVESSRRIKHLWCWPSTASIMGRRTRVENVGTRAAVISMYRPYKYHELFAPTEFILVLYSLWLYFVKPVRIKSSSRIILPTPMKDSNWLQKKIGY